MKEMNIFIGKLCLHKAATESSRGEDALHGVDERCPDVDSCD